MNIHVRAESDTLSEEFIFGEDKGALDLAHKGQPCLCA